MLLLTLAPPAEGQVSKEIQIKSVMLLNLARFVDWPESAFTGPDAPIVIGVVGRDPFGQTLDEAVRGEQINGRQIVVRRFPTVRSLQDCQILFISKSERAHLQEILAAVRGRPVLTVSDMEDFAGPLGGMVRLYTNAENKVRLQVDLGAARAERLQLSSKLLQVAEVLRS